MFTGPSFSSHHSPTFCISHSASPSSLCTLSNEFANCIHVSIVMNMMSLVSLIECKFIKEYSIHTSHEEMCYSFRVMVNYAAQGKIYRLSIPLMRLGMG